MFPDLRWVKSTYSHILLFYNALPWFWLIWPIPICLHQPNRCSCSSLGFPHPAKTRPGLPRDCTPAWNIMVASTTEKVWKRDKDQGHQGSKSYFSTIIRDRWGLKWKNHEKSMNTPPSRFLPQLPQNVRWSWWENPYAWRTLSSR